MRRFVFLGFFIFSIIAYWTFPISQPSGFFQDSAAILLNAKCLNQYGTDEYGTGYPLSFKSFDDAKAPGLIYGVGFLENFFDFSLASFRLLTLLIGFATFLIFFFSFVWKEKLLSIENKALIGIGILLSSWVLVMPRFSVGAVCIPLFCAIHFFYLKRFSDNQKIKFLILSWVSLAAAGYFYHNAKIVMGVVPLLSLFLIQMPLRQKLFIVLIGLVVVSFISFPWFYDLLFRGGASRVSQIDLDIRLDSVLSRFFKHLNGVFFFLKGDSNKRHHLGWLGQFSPLIALFFGAWIFKIFRDRKGSPFEKYTVSFLILSILPACLSDEGVPHALRANMAVIPVLVLSVIGAKNFFASNYANKLTIVALLLSLTTPIWYWVVYPSRSVGAWQQQDFAQVENNKFDHSASSVYFRLELAKQDPAVCGREEMGSAKFISPADP